MNNKKCCLVGDNIYDIFYFSQKGKDKKENQDSFQIDWNNDILVVSLCDGLGSAKHSKVGSEKACELLNDLILKNKSDDVLEDLYNQWNSFFGKENKKFDTTCKFIAISAASLTFGGVGDGWILIKNGDHIVSKTLDHDYLNRTDSMLSPFIPTIFWKEVLVNENFEFCLIATDGFSDDMKKDDLDSFINNLKTDIFADEELFETEMIDLLANWPVETNGDDKTVLCIVKRS